jgi:hypothetical protein
MNEQPKHTPGPWVLETVKTSCGICHKIGPFPPRQNGGKIRHACLYSDYDYALNPSDLQLLANARLIAAAPDLLEALKAQERAEWARRNLDALNADPLHPDRLALVIELQRATTIANMLRESAIAKAEGRGE